MIKKKTYLIVGENTHIWNLKEAYSRENIWGKKEKMKKNLIVRYQWCPRL